LLCPLVFPDVCRGLEATTTPSVPGGAERGVGLSAMCTTAAPAMVCLVRRCLIVDDNARFLAVVRAHLEREGLEVVGTATTQREALHGVGALRPDVVLVDINLGDESGFEVTNRLVEAFPYLRSHVVLISTHDAADYADLIASSPAVGFLPKNLISARAILDLLG
jgi:DNA-binding NarL/FixJ family response regulator